jgi:hypothetical protein
MGVHVVDGLDRQTGVAQGQAHRARATLAVGPRGGDVAGVRAQAEAGELGIHARTAMARMRFGLQHQHRGAIPEHEAIAIAVPWP